MDALQRWLNQKGDGAAEALCKLLPGLGCEPEALCQAIEAEAQATRLEELAATLAAEGIDVQALAKMVAAKTEQAATAESKARS